MPSIYDYLTRDTSFAVDSLLAMMTREKRCRPIGESELPCRVTTDDRRNMIEWCYKIVEVTQLERENVAMAMDIVDRFLSSSRSSEQYLNDKNQFQLLTIASLYLAIKVSAPIVLGSDVMSEISVIYSVQDIEEMERTILKDLEWRIHSPTSSQMVHYILSLLLPNVQLDLSTWGFLLEEVEYQTEFALRDYYFSTQRASTVALAAIFNAAETFDKEVSEHIVLALKQVLCAMSEKFAPFPEVFAVKDSLAYLVESAESYDDDISMTDAAIMMEAKFSLDGDFDEMKLFSSPKSSPRTVACFEK